MAPVPSLPSASSIQTSIASGALLDLSLASSSQSDNIERLALLIARRGYDPSHTVGVEGATNTTFQSEDHARAPSVTITLDSNTSLLKAVTLCPSAATEDQTSLEMEKAISETAQIMKLRKEDVECIIAWYQHLQAVEDPSPDEVQLRDGIQAQLQKRGFGDFLSKPMDEKSADEATWTAAAISVIIFGGGPILLSLGFMACVFLRWRRYSRLDGEPFMSFRLPPFPRRPRARLPRIAQRPSGPAVPDELELGPMPRSPSPSAQPSFGAVSSGNEDPAVPISHLPPLSLPTGPSIGSQPAEVVEGR